MARLVRPFAESKPAVAALTDEAGATDGQSFNERVNRLIHALRAHDLTV